MKQLFVGIALGAAITAAAIVSPPFLSHRVASTYSQALMDCGIRVAKNGVTGGTIDGFTIVGHRYGYCEG